MNVDHDLVSVDEFDALAIEVKAPPRLPHRAGADASSPPTAGSESKKQHPSRPESHLPILDEQWLWEDIGKYPAKAHAHKVAKELGAKNGLIYLLGEEARNFYDSDLARPFRQRRYFYYLSAANFAGCSVTYDLALDELILWIPHRDPRDILWYGTIPSIEDCKANADLDDVRYTSGLARYLQKTLATASSTASPSTSAFVSPSSAVSLSLSCHSMSSIHVNTSNTASSSSSSNSSSGSSCGGGSGGGVGVGGGGGGGPKTVFVLHSDQVPQLKKRGALPLHVDTARLQPAMDAARVVKTPHEVALVRRANAVSSAAHLAVLRGLHGFVTEREVDALFRAFCRARGAPGQAYSVIAGAGSAGSTLHYTRNDAPLDGKLTLVLDAGCEWKCYASDVTRTLPLAVMSGGDDDDDDDDDDNGNAGRDGRGLGGEQEEERLRTQRRMRRQVLRRRLGFTPEAAAIYGVVERMQAECLALMRPGAVFFSVHLHACMVAAAELLRLGILRGGTAADLFSHGTVAAFFPHGLGHHIGLEVHDVSGREKLMLGALRPPVGKREWVSPDVLASMGRHTIVAPPPYKGRQKLEPGMIVTVEPGIYFCREYIESFFLKDPHHAKYIDAEVLERYWDVGGVRIEDDILITEDGHENLTKALKGEDMIRIINGE